MEKINDELYIEMLLNKAMFIDAMGDLILNFIYYGFMAYIAIRVLDIAFDVLKKYLLKKVR